LSTLPGEFKAPDRVVLVEDDADLRASLARVLRGWGATVVEAGTAAEAKALLAETSPDLVLIDVRLPDSSALEVLDSMAGRQAAPPVIAMSGVASADEAFDLGQRGVSAYLAKPFALASLAEAVESACCRPPDLEPMLRSTVGRVGIRDLQRRVRDVMLRQALAISRGNLSSAARLLGVTRQAIQQMAKRHGVERTGSSSRAQDIPEREAEES